MDREIQEHLAEFTLDIRKLKDKKILDQKVHVDTFAFTAECILEWLEDPSNPPQYIKKGKSRIELDKYEKEFTGKEVTDSKYFVDNVQALFSKPSPENITASSEYNKFIPQNLSALYFARIIEGRKGNSNWAKTIKDFVGNSKSKHSWKFRINKEKIELLRYIALSDRNAFDFLSSYLTKFFEESDLKSPLKQFFKNQDNQSLCNLKTSFFQTLKTNSDLGKKGSAKPQTESARIFNPALNILSYKNGKHGTEGGFTSKNPIIFSDLYYNRVNFRDTEKVKRLTRQEREEQLLRLSGQVNQIHQQHDVAKAKKAIKWKYNFIPQFTDIDIPDPYSDLHRGRDANHLLLVHEYPEFEAFTENLMLVTPSQHTNRFHRKGTKTADPNYQRKLLVCQSFYIQRSILRGEQLYSKSNFIKMLNKGFSFSLSDNDSYDKIRETMADRFFDAKQIAEIEVASAWPKKKTTPRI